MNAEEAKKFMAEESFDRRRDACRRSRKLLGMTQVQLAKAAHVDQSLISHFEKGDSDVSPVVFARIFTVLDSALDTKVDQLKSEVVRSAAERIKAATMKASSQWAILVGEMLERIQEGRDEEREWQNLRDLVTEEGPKPGALARHTVALKAIQAIVGMILKEIETEAQRIGARGDAIADLLADEYVMRMLTKGKKK